MRQATWKPGGYQTETETKTQSFRQLDTQTKQKGMKNLGIKNATGTQERKYMYKYIINLKCP